MIFNNYAMSKDCTSMFKSRVEMTYDRSLYSLIIKDSLIIKVQIARIYSFQIATPDQLNRMMFQI